MLRYFRLCTLWETKQYGKLSNDDIEFLNRAQKQFNDAPTDIRFCQWWEGHVSSGMIRAEFRDLTPPREVHFDAELVDGQAALFEACPRPRIAAFPAKPVSTAQRLLSAHPWDQISEHEANDREITRCEKRKDRTARGQNIRIGRERTRF